MSVALMAECLEEAAALWLSNGEVMDVGVEADKQPIATIAAALYQERMRREGMSPYEFEISPEVAESFRNYGDRP